MPDDAHDADSDADLDAYEADARLADLAELQRRAYGSRADEAGRAAAVAELARRRDAAVERGPEASGGAANETEADASTHRALIEASAVAESTAHRRLVGVGVAAALAGVLVGGLGGWQLAVQAAEAAAEAAPRPGTVAALTDADRLAALQWQPVEQSAASRALDREASADDRPGLWGTGTDSWAAGFVDLETVRRLAVVENLSVYGARSGDHAELCLILAFQEVGDVRCTEHGVFPTQGLELATRFGTSTGEMSPDVEVRWLPDGSVRLLTPLNPSSVE